MLWLDVANKIIYPMSQEQSLADLRNNHLENLINKVKPRSRYISQTHVEDQTSSIAKEIVNGDIDVRAKQGNLDLPHDKNDFEEMLRRKFIEQFNRQKQQLEHRLGYVENSLVHLDRFDYLKRRSSAGKLDDSRRSQQWRKEHKEEMKKLEQRKKQLAEKHKEKQAEVSQIHEKIKAEEKEKKKTQILGQIKKIKERTEKRQQHAKQQQQKLKELLGRKELYQKLEQKYHEKEESVLEERKKKLAQIRQLKKPIDLQQILEHQQKVLDIMKDKQLMRSRQIRMNSSRARAYKPSYQSMFYKQLSSPQEEQPEGNPKARLQKVRQFSEQVKQKYAPEVDESKRKEMQDRLERQEKKRQQYEEKQRQLLERPKLKGLQYLELVKKLPKKKDDSRYNAPQTERVIYKNYLGSHSVDMGNTKPWKTILSKGDNKVETAQLLRYESQKIEQRLTWKQLESRLNKNMDNGAIDQEYYEMVKAKLSLLSKE